MAEIAIHVFPSIQNSIWRLQGFRFPWQEASGCILEFLAQVRTSGIAEDNIQFFYTIIGSSLQGYEFYSCVGVSYNERSVQNVRRTCAEHAI